VRLPRGDAFLVRELAALSRYDAGAIADALLRTALAELESFRLTFIRASTPILEPYASVYRRHGFAPVRRVLRISWDLSGAAHELMSSAKVRIQEAKTYRAEVLAELFLAGLRPYWDWWIEDRGGAHALLNRATAYFRSIPDNAIWLVAEPETNPVGLSGVSLTDADEVVLEGVYVVPEFRRRGIGSALMTATLAELKKFGRKRLVVYDTFSFLDSYAPAVDLYLKSGGRIEAEYLHLEKAGAG